MLNDDLLNTYLNDHIAGSVAAIKLIEHCMESNPEGPLHDYLHRLMEEIKQDKMVLENVFDRVEGTVNPAKKAAAFLLEKVERLKRAKKLFGYSPLRRLEELEALTLGIYGKLALWRALQAISPSDNRFSDVDFEELEERAQRQHDEVEKYRLEAAREAFVREASEEV